MKNPEKPLSISFLTDEALANKADKLLAQHNPNNIYPVDIEHIAEFGLGISIMPIPNLKSDRGIDAWLSHDFKHILIDAYCFEHVVNRARFSLAHEIAHFTLHRNIYPTQDIKTDDDLIKFSNSLEQTQIKRIETQSYVMASYLLVPKTEFRRLVDQAISLAGGGENLNYLDLAVLVDDLKEHFFVSGEVIQRRFDSEYPTIYAELSLF